MFAQERKSKAVAILTATYWSPEPSSARFTFTVLWDSLYHLNEPVAKFISAVPVVNPDRSNSVIPSARTTLALRVVPNRSQVAVHSPSLTFVKVTLPFATVSSTGVSPSLVNVSFLPLNFSSTATSPVNLSFAKTTFTVYSVLVTVNSIVSVVSKTTGAPLSTVTVAIIFSGTVTVIVAVSPYL